MQSQDPWNIKLSQFRINHNLQSQGLGPGPCGLGQTLFPQARWSSGRSPGHLEVFYDLRFLRRRATGYQQACTMLFQKA